MARTSSAPPKGKNAFVASARRLKLNDRKAVQKQASRRQEWQDEAWDYFDDVPEIKYGTWFLGNAMSKLVVFPAVKNPDPTGQPIPITDPESGISADIAARAVAEIDRLQGPLGGMPEILRSLNMNLEIAAECYIVGIGPRITTGEDDNGDPAEVLIPESWFVCSVSEVTVKDNGEVEYEDEDGKKQKIDPGNDTVIRVWQRHPKKKNRPDCNMRGVLGECEALMLLTNQVKAEAKSHQNAGLLLVPN